MVRAQNGDKQAFGLLYKKYLDKLYRYALFRVNKNTFTAEDIVQQTFFKAWEKRHSFKSGKGTVQAWLYRIAHNLIIDFYRENDKTVTESEEVLAFTPDETDLEGSLLAIEEQETLMRAMEVLTDEQRSALTLKYIEDVSYAEISTIMNKNEPAVRKLVSRAINRLRKEMT